MGPSRDAGDLLSPSACTSTAPALPEVSVGEKPAPSLCRPRAFMQNLDATHTGAGGRASQGDHAPASPTSAAPSGRP